MLMHFLRGIKFDLWSAASEVLSQPCIKDTDHPPIYLYDWDVFRVDKKLFTQVRFPLRTLRVAQL